MDGRLISYEQLAKVGRLSLATSFGFQCANSDSEFDD